MIRITSKIDGFRRAGISHSQEPTDYPTGYFTDHQLDQLDAESNLIVQELPDETGSEAASNRSKKAAPK